MPAADLEADDERRADEIVSRILSRSGTALASTAHDHELRNQEDAGSLEREARAGTRRVASLTTASASAIPNRAGRP